MAGRTKADEGLPRVDWTQFAGFEAPAYTQIPDDLLDWIMPYLTGAELKALMYIARRTFGFKKAMDAISIEQLCSGIVTHDGRRLDLGTGLKRPTILEALRSLRAKNLVIAEQQLDPVNGSRPTVYALNISGMQARLVPIPLPRIFPDHGSDQAEGGVCQSIPGSMPEHTGGVCQSIRGGYARAYPQKTVKQKTVKQKTGDSNSSKETPVVDFVDRGTFTDSTGDAPDLSDAIASVIDGYSILFHDRVHRRSNCTRALRLWGTSNLGEDEFIALLHEARGITQRRGNIERAATDGSPEGTKNRMPYYFSVVEGLVEIGRSGERPAALGATVDDAHTG